METLHFFLFRICINLHYMFRRMGPGHVRLHLSSEIDKTVQDQISLSHIPHICHFFYTSKIFGESNLHRQTQNYDKIHRKFTPAKKSLARGLVTNIRYEVNKEGEKYIRELEKL